MPIPDRWLNYTKVGKRIEGTRFLAFKTPLAEKSNPLRLRDSERFSPNDLLELRPDLGLIIDLTNTQRYYSPAFIRGRGVQYRKIKCMGQQIPSKDVVKRFCDAVVEFLRDDATARQLIGVHCTHGVNRTGYMICTYMIRHMAISPQAAVSVFADARGHGIERAEFLRGLRALAPDGGARPLSPLSAPNFAAPNRTLSNTVSSNRTLTDAVSSRVSSNNAYNIFVPKFGIPNTTVLASPNSNSPARHSTRPSSSRPVPHCSSSAASIATVASAASPGENEHEESESLGRE